MNRCVHRYGVDPALKRRQERAGHNLCGLLGQERSGGGRLGVDENLALMAHVVCTG